MPKARSARWLPPTGISAADLRRELVLGTLQIVDVREEEAYRLAHLAEGFHAPDSRPADLVLALERHPRTVLVCDDGRMSMMIARTLKFTGNHDPMYLVGGLRAWGESGGELVEISPTGQEHRLVGETAAERARRRLAVLAAAFNTRVFYLALAASSLLIAAVFMMRR